MVSVGKMKAALRAKGYKMFTRPYELNIVGVRSPSTVPNHFDDHIHVFFIDRNGHWVYHVYPATTDPGTFWLRQPGEPQGTAILAEGQYLNVYAIDLHRGKYLALCQRHGAVDIIRDYNRDNVLDFTSKVRIHTSTAGINIHRANVEGTTKTVDRNSAGCQVFANADDFAAFMAMCEIHRSLYGNYFTYTLIDLRELFRAGIRRGAAFLGIGALTLLALWLDVAYTNNTE